MAVLRRVCDDTPRPIHEINPEIPDWLVAIIERLQAKNPEERFQTAAEVEKTLGELACPPAAAPSRPASDGTCHSLPSKLREKATGLRQPIAVAAAAACILGITLAKAFLRPDTPGREVAVNGPPPTPPPPKLILEADKESANMKSRSSETARCTLFAVTREKSRWNPAIT